MKAKFEILTAAFLAFTLSSELFAQDDSTDILASRGDGQISQTEFKARAHRIPDEHRFTVIRDQGRLESMLNDMLRTAQLAADAEAAGFDEDPIVIERMKLAAREELAKAWLVEFVDRAGGADYEAMARERWLLNKDRYRTPETVDVTHLLVSTRERSDAEAQMLVSELSQQVQADPASFEELVQAHSEDPSVAGNRGKFTGVKRGDMVKPFEDSAFSQEVGTISGPVKTDYGYHLIRLDRKNAPKQRSYEEVKPQLMVQVRKSHRDRIRDNYLQDLNAQQATVTPEALERMVENVFGEDLSSMAPEGSESR